MPRVLPSFTRKRLQEAEHALLLAAENHNVSVSTECAHCGRVSESRHEDHKVYQKCKSLVTQIEAMIRHYERD